MALLQSSLVGTGNNRKFADQGSANRLWQRVLQLLYSMGRPLYVRKCHLRFCSVQQILQNVILLCPEFEDCELQAGKEDVSQFHRRYVRPDMIRISKISTEVSSPITCSIKIDSQSSAVLSNFVLINTSFQHERGRSRGRNFANVSDCYILSELLFCGPHIKLKRPVTQVYTICSIASSNTSIHNLLHCFQ